MKNSILIISAAVAMGSISMLQAEGNLEQRLKTLEKRLNIMEQKIHIQNQMLMDKNKTIAILEENSGYGSWFQKVEVGAVVEVQAQSILVDDTGGDSSDIYVATAELGITAQVNDWVASELVLLYEDDGNHSGEFNVDIATITLADPDVHWAVTTGQFVVPFGSFESNMLSDPLTLEMAETTDVAVMISYENAGLNLSTYAFNGVSDTSQNKINDYGITVGYAIQSGDLSYALQLGYMNNLGNTDAIATGSMIDNVPAWTASAMLAKGPVSFIGEYVAATDQFAVAELSHNGIGAEPKAWNLELGYYFKLTNMDSTLAIGFQGSDEASALLAKDKKMLALSVQLFENTRFSIEYANEEDYNGADTNTITGQLAVEF